MPQWDQTKKQKDGTHKTIHARLDVRVLGPSGAVTYLDVRVFHPCSEKGKITNRNRPEAQEREKHRETMPYHRPEQSQRASSSARADRTTLSHQFSYVCAVVSEKTNIHTSQMATVS